MSEFIDIHRSICEKQWLTFFFLIVYLNNQIKAMETNTSNQWVIENYYILPAREKDWVWDWLAEMVVR